MKLLRLLPVALAAALFVPASDLVLPHDAHASVSIAVAFDALVKDADAVAVVTPVDASSVWEDGRIYTYTRVKVEQGVAGELPAGSEGWVRTMGGVVGKIGQMVDGEPVLTAGKSSLLFLRRFKTGGTYEVSARAQGQYPIVTDGANVRKVIRSANVGVLFPPKAKAADATSPAQIADPSKVKLAQEVLHDRSLDDVMRDVGAAWKRLHPPPAK